MGGGDQTFFHLGRIHFRRTSLNQLKTKFIYLICKDSVRTSQRTHCVSIIIIYRELKVKMSHYGLDKPLGIQEVEIPRIPRQSAH